MVGTITLNPCIDRTVAVAGLSIGGMNRIKENRRDVSGKGVNVSMALAANGVPVKTGGFLYHDNRNVFLSGLEALGLGYDHVEAEGSIRENIKVWDMESGITTEINQSGEYIPPEKWEEFKAFFSSFLSGLEVVVLSGSLPKGLPATAYRELSEIASSHGVKVILDAEGAPMLEGLKAKPYLIKPNEYEFKVTFSPEGDDRASIIRKAREVIASGMVNVICITLGSEGALLVTPSSVLYSPVVGLEVKCTQGAGDSIVAGLCKAMVEKRSEKEMLAYGVAMAAGTLSREGTQMCLQEDFERILPMVKVTEVDA